MATSGVLVDRTDGSVHFAHLSFQEHLAAYHLYCTREGDERVAVVDKHMGNRDWWETLRLWAGLTGDNGPDKLTPVLAMLRRNDEGYWLAGMIFADGTGLRSDFEAWATSLGEHLSSLYGEWGDDKDDLCARAWGACKQKDRRTVLTEHLISMRGSLHLLGASRHADWCQSAALQVARAPALQALEAPIERASATARSRALFGSAASWPDGGELAVLRLWPSLRGTVGVRLQTAISVGAQVKEVMALFPAFLERDTRTWSDEDRVLLGRFIRGFDRNFVQYFVRDFDRYFVWYFVRYCHRYFVRNFVQSFDGDFVRSFGGDFVRRFVQHFVRDFVQSFDEDYVRDFYPGFVWNSDRDFRLAKLMLDTRWLSHLAFLELGSVYGRASTRAALAHGKVPEGVPLLDLFRAACRASFAPGDVSLRDTATHACDAFDGDPLWPALARHVARISTDEDRALLQDLARHPEQRQPPLSWGLQYYVRGDLVFDDDSVVTLDELCARGGLAPLPLLEPMPDELDIPFDEAAP